MSCIPNWGDARLPDRFWSRTIPEPNSGCWISLFRDNGTGYCQLKWNGRSVYAHRLAYTRLVGDIEHGLSIDHLCRTRCCCNPAHLEPVTARENTLRGETGASKATCPRGHPYLPLPSTWHHSRTDRRICTICFKETNKRNSRRRLLEANPNARSLRCSTCGQTGHNKRRCLMVDPPKKS